MDGKALAKSKRAHSLHHSKKTHSDRKLKAPSGGTNDARGADKASVKQVKENARYSALPSNWDRYGEEIDLDSEAPLGDGRENSSDVSLPKSKGMDFRHLIAEAQSQCPSNSYLDRFPSLDDLVPGDFGQFGSMLLSRGEAIVSWTGDDNFVVEDERAASHDASFFSLNMHALAEQLAKVDISERLFIEADLLPSELGSKPSIRQEPDQVQISEGKARAIACEEMAFKGPYEKNRVAYADTYAVSLGPTPNDYLELTVSGQGLNEIEDNLNSHRDKKSSQQRTLESPTQLNANSFADPKNKRSTFEAAAAEAELDILLESLSETKLLDSSGTKPSTSIFSKKESSQTALQFTRNVPSPSKPTSVPLSLDDELDDLLEETSLSNQSVLGQPWQVKTVPRESHSPSSSSQSLGKSKVLDDFDSWLDTI